MEGDSGQSPRRISRAIMDNFRSILRGERKKFVERAILVAIILMVIAAIFAPVGVLIEEFLNIESRGDGSFDYEESCNHIKV